MAEEKETFLSRWTRLKQQSREEAASERRDPAPQPARDAPPELPPLEKLTLQSDYSGFFHPKVDDNLRRAALKRLFSDPHFNIMDGLDVYIEDYSKPSPLPAQMLATLRQAQQILDWAKEQRADQEQGPQSSASAAQPALLGEAHTFVTPPSGLATGGGEEAAAEPSTFTERKA